MDFILKKEIPSVKIMKKFNEGIYYCSEKGFNFMGQTIENIDCQSFVVKGNDLFYYDETGKFCYIRESKNQIMDNVGFFSETIENDTILLRYDNNYDSINDVFTFKVGLYNLSNQNKVRSYEKMDNLGVYFKVDSHFICGRASNRNVIVNINSVTDTYHWEVDLNEYCKYSSVATSYQIVDGMIREVFGVFEDKLWVYTDARLLLGLSLQTGEVLLKIDTNKFHSGGFVFFAAHFLPQEGIVGFLIEQHYLEYDLRTLSVIREKNFDTGQHLTDWKFSLSTFTNNYVYFVGNKGSEYGFSQFVGVLNRNNLEVEWWQNMGEGNKTPYFSLTKAPLSDGKKLYVHDSEGTLHIFEKTEDN